MEHRRDFINGDTGGDAVAYLIIAALVFGDAVCALLAGETTLNTVKPTRQDHSSRAPRQRV